MNTYHSHVAGCDHYPEAFMSVCQKNGRFHSPDIQRREYELLIYDGPARLVCDPSNKYDKNAVMVVVNGNKIGYIPAVDAAKIGALLKSRIIRGALVTMLGGNYREPYYATDGSKTIVSGSYPLRADITVTFDSSKRLILLLLCIFGGGLGLHRFYRGEIVWGIVYLCTGGLFLIGWFYDIFRIATGKM